MFVDKIRILKKISEKYTKNRILNVKIRLNIEINLIHKIIKKGHLR